MSRRAWGYLRVLLAPEHRRRRAARELPATRDGAERPGGGGAMLSS
jgi:hypothetical protein